MSMDNSRVQATPIEDLVFSDPKMKTRVVNILRLRHIYTLEQLVGHSQWDLLDMRQFGPACLAQLVTALRSFGLELRRADGDA